MSRQLFSPMSSSKVHPEFSEDNGLYSDSGTSMDGAVPAMTKRRAQHERVNTKLNLKRSGNEAIYNRVPRNEMTQQTLEDAKKRGLKLDDDRLDLDALCVMKQLEIVRTMPVSIKVRRELRQQLYAKDPDFSGSECRAACYKCKLINAQRNRACKLCCMEIDASVTLWRKTFKKIEGRYGSGVITYFTFLKWLLQLNLMIAFLELLFVIIPEAALNAKDFKNNTAGIRAEFCSDLYSVNETEDWYEYILDFVQGSGFMEKTPVFYGHYSATKLDGTINNYSLKTAYLLVIIAYFVISLIFMVHNTAKGFRERVFMNHSEFRQFSNKVFGGWDYSIEDESNAKLIHESLGRELQAILLDKVEAERRNNRSDKENCRIWTIRIVVFLVVLGCLGGAGYLIYYVSTKQAELISDDDYENWHLIVQFLIQYMTTLTIALLNGILPVVFTFIVRVEDYAPGITVNITLARTVLLKLASLGVLVSSLYLTINCDEKDDVCNVGTGQCSSLRCWETYVGQEFYKLVILNLLIQIAVTFGYETLRRVVVTKCKNKVTQMVGQQEFDIPNHVLDLIYLQTLLWFGSMFCPMIPVIVVASLIIIFYLKYFSCSWNYKPSEKPYKNSQSSEFFQVMLLVCYILTALAVYFIVTDMDPSMSCGPFRLEEKMYDVIPKLFNSFPGFLRGILNFVSSAAFAIAVVVILVLVVYYLAQVVYTYKSMLKMMKMQLLHEGNDKQFLLRRLAVLEGRNFVEPPTERRHRKLVEKERKTKEMEDDYSTKIEMPRSRPATKPASVAPLNVPENDGGMTADENDLYGL